jgi:hypothetical protein
MRKTLHALGTEKKTKIVKAQPVEAAVLRRQSHRIITNLPMYV